MDSRLDTLFTAQIRHAETLDTRQGIRRHEEQPGREKHHHEKQEENKSDLWEDQAAVSVRALKVFLEQLVAPAGSLGAPGGEAVGISAQVAAHSVHKTGSGESAKAAQAYARTQRATSADAPPAAPPSAALPVIELTVEEMRIIHALIKDLDLLATRHVETLTLAKSDSFLQALQEAVGRVIGD